jgi:hypothetical protein
MNHSNPLPEFQNPNAILSGRYEAVFIGCDVIERPKFDDTSALEAALRFQFEVPAEGVVITKIDNLRFSQKSNLWRDIKQMTGEGFEAGIFNNRGALWEHIRSLIGRTYTIRCEPSESGAFTKITGISIAGKPALAGTAKPGSGAEEASDFEGDIPF